MRIHFTFRQNIAYPRQYIQNQDISSSHLSLLYFPRSIKQHYCKYYTAQIINTTVLNLSCIKTFFISHTSFKLPNTSSSLSIYLKNTSFENQLHNTNTSVDFLIFLIIYRNSSLNRSWRLRMLNDSRAELSDCSILYYSYIRVVALSLIVESRIFEQRNKDRNREKSLG